MIAVHLDCFSGMSGDMFLGALHDVGMPRELLDSVYDSLGLPIRLELETVKRCGLRASKATIHAEDEDNYRFLPDVEALIAKATLTPRQRDLAHSMFAKLADAEAKSHGIPRERVHFHEVGALDSIADILGAAVGIEWLNAAEFTCSPVPTGQGTVQCAHGVMPIPAPATLELLRGVPLSTFTARGELTTPTGAAIVATVADRFTDTPAIQVERIGIGAGTKDFIQHPNIVRLLVGTSKSVQSAFPTEDVLLMQCQLDDIAPEVLGYCFERLQAVGALDVFTTAIVMKKNRPGVLLSVLCRSSEQATVERTIYQETGTFGLRISSVRRSYLDRSFDQIELPWGKIRIKVGRANGHTIRTPEYEDCAALARGAGVPLREVYNAAWAEIKAMTGLPDASARVPPSPTD